MASIKLSWERFRFPAETSGWVALRRFVGEDDIRRACDTRTVYVVRVCRPFAFRYPRKYSPVIYIGRGNFQSRITSHLSGWINPLGEKLAGVEIEILTCRPRARKNGAAFKDVEADLIAKFSEKYGEKPFKNKRKESHDREHTYAPKELSSAFGLGQGIGYHFAIEPVGSSPLKRKK